MAYPREREWEEKQKEKKFYETEGKSFIKKEESEGKWVYNNKTKTYTLIK